MPQNYAYFLLIQLIIKILTIFFSFATNSIIPINAIYPQLWYKQGNVVKYLVIKGHPTFVQTFKDFLKVTKFTPAFYKKNLYIAGLKLHINLI